MITVEEERDLIGTRVLVEAKGKEELGTFVSSEKILLDILVIVNPELYRWKPAQAKKFERFYHTVKGSMRVFEGKGKNREDQVILFNLGFDLSSGFRLIFEELSACDWDHRVCLGARFCHFTRPYWALVGELQFDEMRHIHVVRT